MKQKFYFKCLANPKAPILVLDNFWEARDMRTHPDYIRVDEAGNEIIDNEEQSAERRIPLSKLI